MSKRVELIIANPAGNTTVMVLTPVPREEYQSIANKLLKIDFGEYCDWAHSVSGEQVAFVLPEKEIPSMEMCGLELCGNASRAFAYYRVAKLGDGLLCRDGRREITINVSGCSYPLKVIVDPEKGDAAIEMPVPIEHSFVLDGILVNMDGISHLVVTDIEATQEKFDEYKSYVYENISEDIPALGVMFIDKDKDRMTPVVYVKDVDTTYFEGSCASGSTAAAYALTIKKTDGRYKFEFKQPDGTLFTEVIKKSGQIKEINLSGHIELSPVISVEI